VDAMIQHNGNDRFEITAVMVTAIRDNNELTFLNVTSVKRNSLDVSILDLSTASTNCNMDWILVWYFLSYNRRTQEGHTHTKLAHQLQSLDVNKTALWNCRYLVQRRQISHCQLTVGVVCKLIGCLLINK